MATARARFHEETAETAPSNHEECARSESRGMQERHSLRRVRVRIVRACHLPPANGPGHTSPFCTISDRTHKGSTALRTRVIENCLYPVWDESFELELDEGYRFELALYCHGRWFFDHLLGSKKVILPNAISDRGGTIVEGEERLVTLILDKTSQGFIEVGITPLNFDYGPAMRGERRELPNMRCVWELHSMPLPAQPSGSSRAKCKRDGSSRHNGAARVQRETRTTPPPVKRVGRERATSAIDQGWEAPDQPARKGKGTGAPQDGDTKGRLLLDAGTKREQAEKRSERQGDKPDPTTTKDDGWLPASLLSSIASLPFLPTRLLGYLPSWPDKTPAPSAHPLIAKPNGTSTSASVSSSTATSFASSSTTTSAPSASYLQLLPPELIVTIGMYVERNTPYNPFEEWREEERSRFKECTHRRKKQTKKKTQTTRLANAVKRDRKQGRKDRHGGGWWREMRVQVMPSGWMRSTRLDMSASFFDLPSFPLSPKSAQRAGAGAELAQTPAATESQDEVEHRERVSEITFLCTAAMKRYAFKDKRKAGLSLRQYMMELDDAPMCSGLLRNDKYTLCNLFTALGQEFRKWEFFLIRKYPSIHPYGYVRTKEDLANFIFHSLGENKLGTVVERERDMVIGGYRALGCTFVTTSAQASLSASNHYRSFNCVTNFFVPIGGEGGDDSQAACVVFNFQYVTCCTKGDVSLALANHHKRERRTFYWMLRSVTFG